MVGLCGMVGTTAPITDLVSELCWNGDEIVHEDSDGNIAIASVTHPSDVDTGHAETDDGRVSVHLWGSVWGFDGPDGYTSIKEPATESCVSLYETHGIDFVAGLNGNFVGAVHDQRQDRLHLFTDRLGTRPLHLAETDHGLAFSSNIQSLPLVPSVDTDFDTDYLAEYFALKRVFGVKTPLKSVEKTQPGSVTTVSPSDGSVETERYWLPRHDPLDQSRSYFVRRLAATLRTAVAERTRPDQTYGVLLSGGSDSRLVLAALSSLDRSVRAYHLNEWWNREATIAARAATAADAEFRFLTRDREYQARALAIQSRLSNFVGYFNQAHAAGFADVLRDEVDLLFTGHYSDMLFKGNHLAKYGIDLKGLGSFDLPIEKPVENIETFVENRIAPVPPYLDVSSSMRDIYLDNVRRDGRRVTDHGVEYPTMREATLASRCPLTNGTSQFFYYSTEQMMPSGTPFLDNRLIDLFLSIPIRYLLRGDLINGATKLLAPSLADLPHARGTVPIRYPFGIQRVGEIATQFTHRHFWDTPEQPHWTHGPWTDHSELIRSHDFIRDTLDDHKDTIRSLPFLRWDGVEQSYEAHQAGEDRMKELYTLSTFLQMPIIGRLMSD